MTTDGLSEDQRRLLDRVPKSGSIGNKSLRVQLGWDYAKYFDERDNLVRLGWLATGKGKGGSVYRLTPQVPAAKPGAESTQEMAHEIAKELRRELDLYEPVRATIEAGWARDQGMKQVVVEITAGQGGRSTGGKLSRPDITVVAVQSYDLAPVKSLEVVTFELKGGNNWDVVGVFEAASHGRRANRCFLVIHVPKGAPKLAAAEDRVEDECEHFGVGLITFEDPADYDTYKVRVEARRNEPAPREVSDFLKKQLPADKVELIRLWLR